MNGTDAPPPIVAGWTFCDEDADRAEELGRKYIGEYWRSVVRHYELVGDHLTKMKGYEAYKEMQESASAPGGVDAMIEFFLGLQVCGTPEQCYEKILDDAERDRSRGLHRRVQLRRHAVRHRRAQHADVRRARRCRALRGVVPLEDQLIARAGTGDAADPASFRLMVVAT